MLIRSREIATEVMGEERQLGTNAICALGFSDSFVMGGAAVRVKE